MSKFVEDLAAVIPIMSKFEPFVKAACEKNPDAHFYFLDTSANRHLGMEELTGLTPDLE